MGGVCKASKRALTGVLAISIALAGCNKYSANDPNLTPAERQLRHQAERFNETVVTGVIVGALLGAALGAAVGGRNAGQTAAIGAAAGAALGGSTGYYIATQNRRYASIEDGLNSRLVAAQKEAASFRDIADTSDQITQQNLTKISDLKDRYKAGQLTAAQYAQQTAPIQQDVELLEKSSKESAKVQEAMTRDISTFGAPSALVETKQQLQDAQEKIDENRSALVKALVLS